MKPCAKEGCEFVGQSRFDGHSCFMCLSNDGLASADKWQHGDWCSCWANKDPGPHNWRLKYEVNALRKDVRNLKNSVAALTAALSLLTVGCLVKMTKNK